MHRCLTSRVSTARLKRRYPCPQSPPCSSDTQSTQGDTCVLRPPGTTNKILSSKRSSDPKRGEVMCWCLSCCLVPQCDSCRWWVCSAACLQCFLLPAVSGDTVVTPALLSHCLESEMTSTFLRSHLSRWCSRFEPSETSSLSVVYFLSH